MYFETKEEGYEIKKKYEYRNCGKNECAIIFYRRDKEDYGIALNYNSYDGTWGQGIYNLKSEEEAIIRRFL